MRPRGCKLLARAARALGNAESSALAALHSGSSSSSPQGTLRRLHTSPSAAAEANTTTTTPTCPSPGDAFLEVPGGKLPFTSAIQFVGGSDSPAPTIPCYRTIDSAGQDVPDAQVPYPLGQDLALRMYTCMARLQTMDTLFYEAQRQGRFSFYLTCQGEEATNIGSAAGLDDKDMVFAQYREQGVLLWRGYTLDQFANQLLGNAQEPGKGRQMPIHYGSPELAYQTISSPLATQMPHAVGAAYAYKMDRLPQVSVAYFGDGASSEGDAHAAFNFAAVLGAPTLFVCRNNGYAISTPAHEQYKGDGIAGRGPMYGIPTIRVDGGDVRAVYNAVVAARARALGLGSGSGSGSPEGSSGGGGAPGPVLIECMSYRCGHHSTSDDSTRYRTSDEMRAWRARDPVARFRTWLVRRGWWDEAQEAVLRRTTRVQVLEALDAASRVAKPPLSTLFTDVYASLPPHLAAQSAQTLDFVRRHPTICPPDVPVQ
ncbi:hypothetical protein PLESTB_001149300 [Pleodorina starrii]|uniref:Dehydrogenase E1 component domain-containing protein n=1 Tax=Pleodorina starrii TaxID=330485 RepID=A0A9W6BR98_9CHLO|nr:hypothetical protein PLESTB_001149300 [Pleodorina starrii]GLC68131.1 hypothetical protein PLESTF_000651500 [Pleodorina starrii]